MNQAQWISLIRGVGIFLGGMLVARGALSSTQLADLLDRITSAIPIVMSAATMLYSIGLLVWGILNHTDAAKIASVAALPDVKVAVSPTASPVSAAAVAAADPAQPNVIKGVVTPTPVPPTTKGA